MQLLFTVLNFLALFPLSVLGLEMLFVNETQPQLVGTYYREKLLLLQGCRIKGLSAVSTCEFVAIYTLRRRTSSLKIWIDLFRSLALLRFVEK